MMNNPHQHGPPKNDVSPGSGPEEAEAGSGVEVLVLPLLARFELGQLVATPGALAALEQANTSPAELVGRHLTGDWGTLDKEDWATNDRALREGTRLLSAYTLPSTGEKVWVITEWDRSVTTILRPDEY
jgi:hypothetical protein